MISKQTLSSGKISIWFEIPTAKKTIHYSLSKYIFILENTASKIKKVCRVITVMMFKSRDGRSVTKIRIVILTHRMKIPCYISCHVQLQNNSHVRALDCDLVNAADQDVMSELGNPFQS